MTKKQRNDRLLDLGAAMSQRDLKDVSSLSLKKIVTSDEDEITLFHASGLSLSILKQIQPNQTNNHRLDRLAQLSEIFPLVSIEPLSTDLSSFFRNFLCNPLPYLENDHPKCRSSLSAFMDILCNEVMACSILGIGDVVYETIATNFHAFSESISQIQTHRPWMDYDFRDFQMIVEISQNETEPLERIAAFLGCLNIPTIYEGISDETTRKNLLSQCLQHTATFLNVHPDLIDSFLETVDLSTSPSDTPFRHDRHLNLISALSQSSSPLFTKLSEPLLDPTFPLHSLLSPRSFTDPASSFIRMASTNPVFFRRLVETHTEHILDMAIPTAVSSARVVSDSPSEPHCLDFGRMTQNWVVLLNTIAVMKMDLTQNQIDFNSLPSSLLTLLVLSAASTNDELSNAAVSVFSNQFGLSPPHTEALLFATPPTFAVSDAFTQRQSQMSRESDHAKSLCQSICAEAGRCVVMQSLSEVSDTDHTSDFARMLGIDFAGCLVTALHSTTTLPHSFPFFSPELCGLSKQPSVWNDTNRPSALTALTTLADIEISLAFHRSYGGLKMSPEDETRRDINFLHLFPFLGTDSQIQFLSSFHKFYRSKNQKVHHSFPRMVEGLLEMATVNSYNTPIALLKEMRKVTSFFSHVEPETHTVQHYSIFESSFEQSIVERLKTAGGEERWKLVTQLVVVSNDTPDITNELMKAENDAQALLILHVHKIRSIRRLNYLLNENPDTLDCVVEFAGHINNLPLVDVALAHIVDTVEICIHPPETEMTLSLSRNQALQDVIVKTLPVMAACRREGEEEGCAVGKYGVTSQIVESCLKVLRFLMKFESFDPTPVIDSLVSLAVTEELSLLRSILIVLQGFEERTRNTPTPFSISRATAPFRGIHESSVTQQPLPSIVASILLSASLESQQPLTDFLRGLNETLFSDITKETAKIICFFLEEKRTTHSRALTSFDSFGFSLDQMERHPTPQQFFLTLCKMIFPNDQLTISGSTLLPLAPFLTRILTIVVPSSPDRLELCFEQDEHSQLLNSFLSLVLSLINTGTPSTLSTPPLSSLLSVLSIALVRLDTIPSSLYLYTRFNDLFEKRENQYNPKVRQVVLALSSEGMEDRSNLALDSFSLDFLNKWKGANAPHHVDLPNGLLIDPLEDPTELFNEIFDF
ncbi:hypothetical protein BLNAU_6115 [Blattamonas nauphoetae]|uniref:Uncharacterized protein n=1 Tax=Blattamonas nauphoetae TaxID=2049346 RepID=A0ABQ9Y545_9EUKA|nr:hypothetical protein BLNAU_6115 [Blattamonas nauphoetae]